MKNLKKIIKEIENTSEYYHRSPFYEVKDAYSDYVKLIILEAPKNKQYELCDYWEKLKR